MSARADAQILIVKAQAHLYATVEHLGLVRQRLAALERKRQRAGGRGVELAQVVAMPLQRRERQERQLRLAELEQLVDSPAIERRLARARRTQPRLRRRGDRRHLRPWRLQLHCG